MKKIFLLILTAALALPSASVLGYEQYIKIGLYFASGSKDSITLTSPSGFTIGHGEDAGFARAYDMAETEIIVSKGAGGGFLINGMQFDTAGDMSVKPILGNIGIGGVNYRGFALLRRMTDSDMTVINVVGLEEYLYSVVGREMSPSWNIEALKAQAVCARTYAMTHMNKYQKYGFNLCNTQNSQVYSGIGAESESTIRAVNETAGQTVRYGGKTVEVFYFSSGGGSTEDSKNVWSGDLPYLKSVADPYENPSEATKYHWTETITREALERKIPDVGRIQYIEIVSRAPSGRVTELRVVGDAGTKTAVREGVRGLIGYDILSSQQFTIAGGAPVLADGTALQSGAAVLGGDGVSTLGGDVSVLGGYNQTDYSLTKFYGDSFTFVGRGWGHSVGMSQWGAKAMADSGFTYTDILKFYFTGVEVY